MVGDQVLSGLVKATERGLQEVSPCQLHTLYCQVQCIPTYYIPSLRSIFNRPTTRKPELTTDTRVEMLSVGLGLVESNTQLVFMPSLSDISELLAAISAMVLRSAFFHGPNNMCASTSQGSPAGGRARPT